MDRLAVKNLFRAGFLLLFIRLLSLLPLRLNHAIGAAIGRLANRFSNEIRDTARRNIHVCLSDLPLEKKQHLVDECMQEIGKTLTETAALWLWSGQRSLGLVQQVQGEQRLQQAMEHGKGVILAFPHLGAWEMVSLYCSSRYPMATLYRPPRMQLLEKTVRRGRERLGARLYPTDNSGVRALLQALKKGEMVGILPDQEPGVGQGVYAPFFGYAAYSMTLVSRLAQKTGAEVVFAYAERLPKGGGYRIHFLPAPEGIDSRDTYTSVSALNRGVEHCIRQCPAQYQWGYRRFRTRPPGDLRFY